MLPVVKTVDGKKVYAWQTTYKDFVHDIKKWSQLIHDHVKDGIFEIYFNNNMLTQGGGAENIMYKRISDGKVLSVVFFGAREDVMGSKNVTADLLDAKFNELMQAPPVLFEIMKSQFRGHHAKITKKYDLKTGKPLSSSKKRS